MRAMNRVAIIGASGFVGSRLVEMFHLNNWAEVRPVVRGVKSLARVARFDLDWKLADATDLAQLTAALEGCDTVVHSVVGDTEVIEAAARVLYPAAQAAGAKRIVYLSTASVHGQNPALGTSEQSVLSDRQTTSYNNAKVRAEWTLQRLRERGNVELVMLRPSIVFGPRDRWVTQAVQEIRQGTAWLIDQGKGVCNTIYVDNLVEAVRLAASAESTKVDGQAFLAADQQNVTWADFYYAVCDGIGVERDRIQMIDVPVFPGPSNRERFESLRTSKLVQAMLPVFPGRLKNAGKAALKGWAGDGPASPWALPGRAGPSPTRELVALQSCAVRLPDDKARQLLGYRGEVSFAEGMRRTLAWHSWCEEIATSIGQ